MSSDEPNAGDNEGQDPDRRDRPDQPGDSGSQSGGQSGGQGQNPFAGTPFEMLGQFGAGFGGAGTGAGGADPSAMFEQIRAQMQSMMTWEGGPINWSLAQDMARQTIRQAGDASLTPQERSQIDDAVQLAEHWLDSATTLPASSAGAVAWNRADWLEGTIPTWRKLVDPLATHVVQAMGNALPEEARSMAGPFGEMMEKAGGLMFGVQVGQGLGQLATEVCGATDVGLPLGTSGRPALLPANIAAFGEGLGLPAEDVRLYLALRECAHQRLAHHAPWLSAHLVSAVEEYARGMHVDLSKLEGFGGAGGMAGLDLSNPEALQEALGSGLLEPEETPRQKAALARLETALALVEGWVDDVVTQAAAPRMPSAGQLQEAIRRRRAEGGPAEQTFATLVGLELRPRRLRDASALWSALRESRGAEGRDALWTHPDLLPSSDDLDDPEGFVDATGSSVPLDLGGLEDLPPVEEEQEGKQGGKTPSDDQDNQDNQDDRNDQDGESGSGSDGPTR